MIMAIQFTNLRMHFKKGMLNIMKNLFKLTVFLLAVLVGGIFAVAPSSTTIVAPFFLTDTTITVDDTLSETDSITIISNWSPKRYWQYSLSRNAFTGTGASGDSVKVAIVVDCYDKDGVLFERFSIDSATSAPGEAYLIPLGTRIYGVSFDIKAIDYNGGAVEIIPGKWQIQKTRDGLYFKNP